MTATPSLSVTWMLETGMFPVFVTTYVQVTGVPTGTLGPGGRSASTPFVDFSMSIAGVGARRLTMRQVTIESCGTVPLNPFVVGVNPGNGVSVGVSGVWYVQRVADWSFTYPGGSASVTAIVELPGVVFLHWKFAKPSGPVVVVVLGTAPAGGSTQDDGVGDTVAFMLQPTPGWRAWPVPGSSSITLRMFTEGAQSWNAAARSACSSFVKSGSLYTSWVEMLNVPVPLKTSGPDTAIIRLSEDVAGQPLPDSYDEDVGAVYLEPVRVRHGAILGVVFVRPSTSFSPGSRGGLLSVALSGTFSSYSFSAGFVLLGGLGA